MTTEIQEGQLSPAVLHALSIGSLPDVDWDHADDLCDCTFQRVGMWKNPYLAETLEIRLCCIWAKLAEQYPDFVRTIPGYFNENDGQWITTPWEWDGEAEMPKAIWYRQLARKLNRPLEEIRAEYASRDELRPKGWGGKRTPFMLQIAGTWRTINLASRRSVVEA